MTVYQDVFQRYEKKYLVTQQQFNQLARVFSPRMVPDRFAQSTISNIYYDTPDFRLIRYSLDRPPYKEKLRLRAYNTPAADTEVFLEIKKKFDHIVYKRRIGMPYGQAVAYLEGQQEAGHGQIAQEIEWFRAFYHDLCPAMFIYYDRFAVMDREQPDLRITFDSGIRWRADDLELSAGTAGEPLLDAGTCLMEIKILQAAPFWLSRALSEAGVFPTHFSKYGAAYQAMLRENRSRKDGVFCA